MFSITKNRTLLKPLINLNVKEVNSEMADLTPVKNECEKKIRLFKSLLRRHHPTGMDPGDVQENHKSWNEEISSALTSLEESVGNMIIDHRAAMSADVINHWELQVVESEKSYRDHRAATYEVVKSAKDQAVSAPAASMSMQTPAQEYSRQELRLQKQSLILTQRG